MGPQGARARQRLTAAAWLAALAIVRRDERTIPRLADGAPEHPGTVTAVVPARNEAHAVAETLRRLVAQRHPRLEVVAVDDGSTDGTGAAMREVSGVEVVTGTPPPEGWLGKSWACHQGAARARGEWLLFVDADVHLEPGAVGALLALAEDAGGATAFPCLVTGSVPERAVLPLAGAIMQTLVMPAWLARAPRSPVAIAVGGCLLLRREVYAAIGGHAAVRGEIVEDLALARAAKRAGRPVAWANGRDLLSLRYYRGAGDMWAGWRKNAAHAWHGPWPLGVAAGAAVVAAVLAPWLDAARGRPAGLAGVALQAATLRAVARAGTDIPAPYALAGPVGAAFLAAVGAASLADRLRGEVRWRGRRVSA